MEIQSTEEQFRSLFENSIDAVLFASPEGTIIAANAEACRVFGRTEEEICQLGRGGLVDPTDPRLPALLEERARTGRFKGELNFKREDGSIFPGEVSSAFYKDKSGAMKASIIIRDVTERKQAEEALRKSEERFRTLFEAAPIGISINNATGQFLQVNRAFQEMFQYTADELKTRSFKEVTFPDDLAESKQIFGELVTGKRTMFRLEKRYRRKNDEVMWANTVCSAVRDANGNFIYTFAMVEDITERKRAEHLLGLINEVLDLAKIESKQMELRLAEFNLPELLKSVVAMARIRAEQKGLAFVYEVRSPLPVAVRGDAQRLRQVLINLLGNAIKFTAQGSVSLNVGSHEAAPDKTQIRFQVEDTGVGIAPENWESIFLPFHQVGDARDFVEGTGLGLTISREFVRMMGGELQLQSTPGVGSIFWLALDLPAVAEGGATTVASSPHHLIGYEGARRKILVVDDKKENRAVILHLLAPLGFEMHEAADGREGLEKTMALRPDLILMDLVMPEIDGFEATRRIRQQSALANIPIIALSASVFEHNRQQSLDAGCNDFLPKPVKAENLLEALRQQLKLEWIYSEVKMPEEKKSDLPLIGPPATEAAALMDLAMRGDIKDLLQRVESLEQRGEEFKPLTGELRRLAKEYRMKEIRELVQRFILSR